MTFFHYQNNELFAEQVPVSQITQQFGTPCYIYSRAALEQQWHTLDKAFANHPHRICYSVKANSNLAILNLLAQLHSSFDIVSGGECARVLAAGGKADKIIFSGVGKTSQEIKDALTQGIYCFSVESSSEINRINQLAGELGKRAPIAFRVNPDIEVITHPYIATGLRENKFGIAYDEIFDVCKQAASLPHIEIVGIGSHIGSQLTTLEPFLQTIDKLLELHDALNQLGIRIKHLDIGGGLGISYHTEHTPSIAEYAKHILAKLKGLSLELILEPGRLLVAEAGILVTQIEYLKHHSTKNFAVVDAAMNDLVRPSFYDAWHGVLPVKPRTDSVTQQYDVVGPVCESSDFLAKNRHLCLQEGDLLALCSVGAYGFVMSSNYNSRPRAAEILVDKNKMYCVRKREEIADLFAGEKVIP